jgi:hypothetical protein
MAIGRALAEVDDFGALTAAQLEDMIGKHQSNLKKAADELVGDHVLEIAEPPQENGQRGRRARTAFTFADGERERFEELIDEEPESEFPEVGTHLVFVDAQSKREALWKVLSQAGVAAGLDRACQLDGDRPEMMFAFRGPTAVDDSLDFLEILATAELSARRQSISKSNGSREIRKMAQRRRQRVERSKEQLGSMQTAPRRES